MPVPPLRVLCLDIEGGYGGSSRSLFLSLKNMDRDLIAPEVWCRKTGPIQRYYREVNIPVKVETGLVSAGALPRISRSLYEFITGISRLILDRQFTQMLLDAAEKSDVIHFNHEGLFLVARWLRSRTDKPFTMHLRKILAPNWCARWQTASISQTINHVVCISEREQENFRALGGNTKSTVVYNIVEPQKTLADCVLTSDPRFKACSIANYSWNRGGDRLVDLAVHLKAIGRRDIVFVVAGDMAFDRSLPGEIGKIGQKGGGLKDYAQLKNVADMFLFLGHVDGVGSILTACDIVVKPTRRDMPWGRDILEGMMAAKPVVTIGTFEKFIQNDKTGVLFEHYETETFARAILDLQNDPEKRRRLGLSAQQLILSLCNGKDRAANLMEIWQSEAKANNSLVR